MVGLKGRARALLAETSKALARADLRAAWGHWMAASFEAAGHAEILRWQAVLYSAESRSDAAVEALRAALHAAPDDPELMHMLGSALAAQGQHDAALLAWHGAAAETRHPVDWLALGIAFDQHGYHEDALAAAEGAVVAAPDAPRARLLRARCLQALGDAPAAALEYRVLIRRGQETARAWFALVDIKTESIDASELLALEHALRRASSEEDRTLLGFALGNAYEAAGRFEQAFETLQRANARIAASRRWNAPRFDAESRAIDAAFGAVSARSEVDRGSEILFVVGLPRSGSTLIEQVLAAHPRVEAASELPYLEQVIARESHRRQQPLAQWAAQASAADWARLGREYLDLTARWRTQRPVSTDKMPSNWRLAGAALAMLPAARFIDCERDTVETCWSCFKQFFAPGKADYSYAFADLAAYAGAHQRLARHWAGQYPAHFRTFRYEDLIEETEGFVRELLSFCRLDFDPACLRPHEAKRAVRTASSAQVRQPIRRVGSRALQYGPLLDPLRNALAINQVT